MKYIVFEGNGFDLTTSIHSTLAEANSAAENSWNHLTAAEQKEQHIYVAGVDESSMWIDHESDDDCVYSIDDAFDSQVWYAVMRDNEDDDWGTGSYYRSAAIDILLNDYPDGHIEVINVIRGNPGWVETITRDEVI